MNVYYLSVKLGVNFSVMFHSTNGNDFCSETGSSTASLLCGNTVGYPSDSLASCFSARQHIACLERYTLSPIRPSVCLSVRRVEIIQQEAKHVARIADRTASQNLWGHLTSSVTWPFDSPYVISYWWSFGTKPLSLTVSEMFNVKCNAIVDVTLIRPLNEGQGHSFWYQSISHTRLPIGSQ